MYVILKVLKILAYFHINNITNINFNTEILSTNLSILVFQQSTKIIISPHEILLLLKYLKEAVSLHKEIQTKYKIFYSISFSPASPSGRCTFVNTGLRHDMRGCEDTHYECMNPRSYMTSFFTTNNKWAQIRKFAEDNSRNSIH